MVKRNVIIFQFYPFWFDNEATKILWTDNLTRVLIGYAFAKLPCFMISWPYEVVHFLTLVHVCLGLILHFFVGYLKMVETTVQTHDRLLISTSVGGHGWKQQWGPRGRCRHWQKTQRRLTSWKQQPKSQLRKQRRRRRCWEEREQGQRRLWQP